MLSEVDWSCPGYISGIVKCAGRLRRFRAKRHQCRPKRTNKVGTSWQHPSDITLVERLTCSDWRHFHLCRFMSGAREIKDLSLIIYHILHGPKWQLQQPVAWKLSCWRLQELRNAWWLCVAKRKLCPQCPPKRSKTNLPQDPPLQALPAIHLLSRDPTSAVLSEAPYDGWRLIIWIRPFNFGKWWCYLLCRRLSHCMIWIHNEGYLMKVYTIILYSYGIICWSMLPSQHVPNDGRDGTWAVSPCIVM